MLSFTLQDAILTSMMLVSIYFCLIRRKVIGTTRGDNESDNNYDPALDGPIARKAGLLGLTRDERRLIIEHVFQRNVYKKSDYEAVIEHEQDEKSENVPKEESQCIRIGTQDGHDNDFQDSSHQSEDEDWCQTSNCSICFSKYRDGVSIVFTNTECNHMFHYDCAMEWHLGSAEHEQKNDHCPYCRKEIMTPSAMRSAAMEVLSEKRFQQICTFSEKIEKKQADAQLQPQVFMGIFSQSPNTSPAYTAEVSSISSSTTQDIEVPSRAIEEDSSISLSTTQDQEVPSRENEEV